MDPLDKSSETPAVSSPFLSELGRRVQDSVPMPQANPESVSTLLSRDPVYRALAQDPLTASFAELRKEEILTGSSSAAKAAVQSPSKYRYTPAPLLQTPLPRSPGKESNQPLAGTTNVTYQNNNNMMQTPATGHTTYTASVPYTPSAQELDKLQLEVKFHQEQARAAAVEVQALQSKVQELERNNGHFRRECEERAREIASLSAAKMNAEKAAASMEVRLKAMETSAGARSADWEQAKASYQSLLDKKAQEIRKLSDDLARLQEQNEQQALKEKELRDQTTAQSTTTQALTLELETTRAALDQSVSKVEKLERAAAELRRQRKGLQDDIKELEGLLAASESERKELRTRYVDLGEKMELLLREELASKEQSDRDVLALDVLAAEKAELRDKAKQLKKAKIRLEQHMAEMQSENQQLRQHAEERHERLSLSEKRVQVLLKKQQENQQQFDAQLAVLKGQVEELEAALEKSRRRNEAARRELQKEFEERANLELSQMEVKYERRIAELELEVRHLRTLDQNQQQSLFQQYVEAKLESLRLLEDPRVKERSFDEAIERRVKAVLDECISKEEHVQKINLAKGEVTRDFQLRLEKQKADSDQKVSTITNEWRERLVETERKWAARELDRVKEVEDRVRKECAAQLASAAADRERLEEDMAALKSETEHAVKAMEDAEKAVAERTRAIAQLEERLEEEEAAKRKATKRGEDLSRDLQKTKSELQDERAKLVAAEGALHEEKKRVQELTEAADRTAKEVQRLKDTIARAEQAGVREKEELTRALRAEAEAAIGQIRSDHETAALDARIRADHAAATLEAMRKDMREVSELVKSKTTGVALERAVRALEDKSSQLEGALRLVGSVPSSIPGPSFMPSTPAPAHVSYGADMGLATPTPATASRAVAGSADSVALLERLLQESRKENGDVREQVAAAYRQLDTAKAAISQLESKVAAALAAAAKADSDHEEASKRGRVLAAELESALQEVAILRKQLQEESDRRATERAAHEQHMASMEAAMTERSEAMKKQSDALAEDLRAELERVRGQWKAEAAETERRFHDRLALAEQENRMLASQVRAETERDVRAELGRQHQAAMMEAEAREGALQGQINAYELRFEKVRAVLGPYADMLDDELKLDPAAEASLKSIELRVRLEQEVDRCRALTQDKEELQKEVKKLKTRVERREEDFTIVLLNVKEVLGLDTSNTSIEDGLLSTDKARFTQSLNRMRQIFTQQMERRQMAAISEALEDIGGSGSAEDPTPSAAVARRARKERDQAMQSELASLRGKLQELQREHQFLKREADDHRIKADRSDKESTSTREELTSLKDRLRDAENALGVAQDELARAQKQLESHKAEATRLQGELTKQVDKLTGELAQAKDEGAAMAASLASTKQELAKAQEANATLTQEAAAAKAETQKTREEAQRAVQAAEERLDRGRRESMMAAEMQFTDSVKPLRSEVRRLQDQVQELTRQYQVDLDAKEAECADLRRRIGGLADEVRGLQEKAHKLQLQLQEEADNADKARADRANLHKEKELLENQVRYLEAKTARAVKDAEVQKARLKEREEKVAELNEIARTARKERRDVADASALIMSPRAAAFMPAGSPLSSPGRNY